MRDITIILVLAALIAFLTPVDSYARKFTRFDGRIPHSRLFTPSDRNKLFEGSTYLDRRNQLRDRLRSIRNNNKYDFYNFRRSSAGSNSALQQIRNSGKNRMNALRNAKKSRLR